MVRLALLGDADRADQLMKLMPRVEGAKVTVRAVGVDQLGADHDAFDAAIVLFAIDIHDCEQLVAAGKHLLLPITCRFSTGAIQGLSNQCQRQGLCLMAGGTDRLVPSLQAARQSLAAGELGEPGLVRVHRWATAEAVTEHLSRDLDLVLSVFQAMPGEVYAVARSVLDADEPDYLQVHLGFAGGGMAFIDRSSTLPPGDGYFSFSVIGSNGAAYADDHLNKQLVFRGEHPDAVGTGSEELAALGDLQEFCRAIREQRAPLVTGADWLAATEVAEAVMQSAKSNSVATVAAGGDHEH
mgnify:FL=1